MATTAPTKVLDLANTSTTPLVVPYILLPEAHNLCYYTFDHTKSKVYVHMYVPDPNKTLTLKVRGDEIDSESTFDDFYERNCQDCDYYFNEREEEEEIKDCDGNDVVVRRTIRSCCDSYRSGVEAVAREEDVCQAGYDLPDPDERSDDVYEWSTETVDSSPMYYMMEIIPPGIDNEFYRTKLSAAMAFAGKILSIDKQEYAWYCSPMWRGFNIYDGSLPSGICWGADENIPKTVHLEEIYTLYTNSIFNDDIVQLEEYGDSLASLNTCMDDFEEVNKCEYENPEDYHSDLSKVLCVGDKGKIVALNDPSSVIVSSEDTKAAGFLCLNRNVDAALFNRMYVSGVPFKVSDPLSFNTVLIPIYRYEYVNPNNQEQRINGFITETSTGGHAWFMADTSATVETITIRELPLFDTWRFSATSSQKRQNYLTVFGQIQL